MSFGFSPELACWSAEAFLAFEAEGEEEECAEGERWRKVEASFFLLLLEEDARGRCWCCWRGEAMAGGWAGKRDFFGQTNVHAEKLVEETNSHYSR